LRLFIKMALTPFFFAPFAGAAYAAVEDVDASLAGYVARMVLALAILCVAGYLAVRFAPGRFRTRSAGRLKLIGALNVGRDMVYVIQAGPDVIAVLSGKNGATVLGRWSGEEWDDDGKDERGGP
jgi:hypothetical protein